jgi:hypothetical protein
MACSLLLGGPGGRHRKRPAQVQRERFYARRGAPSTIESAGAICRPLRTREVITVVQRAGIRWRALPTPPGEKA